MAVQWCRLVGSKIPEKRPETYKYAPTILGSRAIAYLILTRPHLVKYKDKADELLKKYKERPTRRVR